MEENVVYGTNIYFEKRIKSTASKSRSYVVKLGDVSWGKDGNFIPAVYVLVEYSGVEQKTINPHILIDPSEDGMSDFTKILEVMKEIKERFKIK